MTDSNVPNFKSEFSIFSNRFVSRQNEPLMFVMRPNYAGPVLDMIRIIERVDGSDYAERILIRMEKEGPLHGMLREINDADHLNFFKAVSDESGNDDRGRKMRCECSALYYDLKNPDKQCPKCQRSVKLATLAG